MCGLYVNVAPLCKNGCVDGRHSFKIPNYLASFLPKSCIRNNDASMRFREGLSMKASMKDRYVLKYHPVCQSVAHL